MKRIAIIISIVCTLSAYANVPKGAVIYLDATQEWCCKTTYAVCTSSGGDAARLMQAVEGVDGLYSYTVTLTDGVQDNFRFGWSDQAFSRDQPGWNDFYTQEPSGGWSASKPYYIVTSEHGDGYWAAQPLADGETRLDSIQVLTPSTCLDSTFAVEVVVWFSGAPCLLRVEGDQIGAQSLTDVHSPHRVSVSGLKETPGVFHSVEVSIYRDKRGQSLLESQSASYISPEIECEVEEDLGDKCTNEPLTLTTTAPGDVYIWSTGESSPSITVTPSLGTNVYTVEVYGVVLYPEQNLMSNGDFESYDATGRPMGFTSSYNYVGLDPYEYYADHSGAANIFALTSNANDFWHDYARVLPHGGQYMALFDAGKSGFAWKASTNDNPELIIDKDSIYLFSYWVACPNTPQYNQNPAKLQFRIEYKDASGAPQWEDLGTPYVLGQEKPLNKWVQQTVMWKAPESSSVVSISVEDLNNASSGNDFCLDDIMFQKARITNMQLSRKETYYVNGIDCGQPTPVPGECEEIVYRKWNDFLFVDNSANEYVGYQWYCDGELIEGATGQYYRAPSDLSVSRATYHVLVTKRDGSLTISCEETFGELPRSRDEYPAPTANAVSERQYMIGAHCMIKEVIYDDGHVEVEKYIY